jgi:hypothetical protein
MSAIPPTAAEKRTSVHVGLGPSNETALAVERCAPGGA